MTIQPSVLIWTVICFGLLAAILHTLLFRPVLRLMDRRRERIAAAAAKEAGYRRMADEYAAGLERRRAELLARQQLEQKRQLEQLRADNRSLLEAANETRLRKVDAYSVKAEADCARLLELLSEQADELAVSFARSLTK